MDHWREMGYKIALWRDDPYAPDGTYAIRTDMMPCDITCDLLILAKTYPGYAQSVNTIARHVLAKDPFCDWIVAAGDDTLPDPYKRAEEIAQECSEHFRVRIDGVDPPLYRRSPEMGTMGVMQPTGDTWSDRGGRIIERIAGSPWLGREWCRRANQGNGPLWSEYTHCFADEELQCVAQRLGVFWQRPDLTHMHHNWARKRGNIQDRPDFLIEATSAEHWRKYSALFKARKDAGFPGSEPIA